MTIASRAEVDDDGFGGEEPLLPPPESDGSFMARVDLRVGVSMCLHRKLLLVSGKLFHANC